MRGHGPIVNPHEIDVRMLARAGQTAVGDATSSEDQDDAGTREAASVLRCAVATFALEEQQDRRSRPLLRLREQSHDASLDVSLEARWTEPRR